jgi:hypothetical protein
LFFLAAFGDFADDVFRDIFEELNALNEELVGVDENFTLQGFCGNG